MPRKTRPRKTRELKAELRRAGFRSRPGRGSHTVWNHPALPAVRLTIGRRDGEDAPEYLERQVRAALAALARQREEQL